MSVAKRWTKENLSEFLAMRSTGASLRKLGSHYGISQERARQVLAKAESSLMGMDRLVKIRAMSSSGMSDQSIAEAEGLSVGGVRRSVFRHSAISRPRESFSDPHPFSSLRNIVVASLRVEEVKTLDDLFRVYESGELMNIPHVGAKSYAECVRILRMNGFPVEEE